MLSGLSFRCLKELLHGSSKYRCLIKAVRDTGNFVGKQATLVQGCTSEAQLNMDVNLCRLPDEIKALCGICLRRTVQRFSQSNRKDGFYNFPFAQSPE